MSALSAQRVHGVLLLAMALASCAVHCWQFGPGREDPPRCRRQSVTPVSCADTHFADSLLPHPDDCRLFYYCVSPAARPVCRQCPARLHFNPRLRVCDHPAAAGCGAPRPTRPTRPTSPTSPTSPTAAPGAPAQDTTATDVDITGTTEATTRVETTTETPTWETTGTAANA